jgi:hypothetical protein
MFFSISDQRYLLIYFTHLHCKLQNVFACESFRGKNRACLKNICFSKKVFTFHAQISNIFQFHNTFYMHGQRFNLNTEIFKTFNGNLQVNFQPIEIIIYFYVYEIVNF